MCISAIDHSFFFFNDTATTEIYTLSLHDALPIYDAWLDGPLGATAGWLKDGETVYYGSEETGFAHLYTVSASGGAPRALTRGAWEVQQVALAPDGKTFYLHTNEGDFAQVHCYALDIASGRKTQLTSVEGRQDVVVAPDGKLLAVLHSTADRKSTRLNSSHSQISYAVFC